MRRVIKINRKSAARKTHFSRYKELVVWINSALTRVEILLGAFVFKLLSGAKFIFSSISLFIYLLLLFHKNVRIRVYFSMIIIIKSAIHGHDEIKLSYCEYAFTAWIFKYLFLQWAWYNFSQRYKSCSIVNITRFWKAEISICITYKFYCFSPAISITVAYSMARSFLVLNSKALKFLTCFKNILFIFLSSLSHLRVQ